MGDVLKAPVGLGMAGNAFSQFGLVSLSDNYGNATSGKTLECKGYARTKMTGVEAADLHWAILPHAMLALNFRGEIDLGNMQSPLETLCESKHHVLPGVPFPAVGVKSKATKAR